MTNSRSKIVLRNRVAIIHFDSREMNPRPKPLPPDVRSIAWLIEKDHRHFHSSNDDTRRLTLALFALWDHVITENTAKLEAIRNDLVSKYRATIPPDQSKQSFPVLWNLPQTWRLIRLILTLDESLTMLGCTRLNNLISSNKTKTLRGKLVRPVRNSFIEIAATSRNFRRQIQSK